MDEYGLTPTDSVARRASLAPYLYSSMALLTMSNVRSALRLATRTNRRERKTQSRGAHAVKEKEEVTLVFVFVSCSCILGVSAPPVYVLALAKSDKTKICRLTDSIEFYEIPST